MSSKLLRLENLSVGYSKSSQKNRVVLENINLTAQTGDLIAILGENGAGKSTLMRSIAKLQKPLEGTIFLLDRHLQDFKPKEIAQKIAMVLTEKLNIPHLDVKTLLSLGRYPYNNWLGQLDEKDKEIISWAMQVTETEAFEPKFITELSDGEKQKIMIARALVQDTPIILLDEPTAHLDFANKVMIFMLLKKLSEENQKTIIFSTHDLELALQLASKIWLIPSKSQKLIVGSPEDLVLSGRFEDIFDSQKVNFDSSKGNFRVNAKKTNKIKLIAQGKYFFWTENALARIGFELDNTAPTQIIFDSANYVWNYESKQEKQSFESIEKLIDFLKKK